MTAIGPGTLVRCVVDNWELSQNERDGLILPTKGKVYTVRDIECTVPDSDTPYLRFVEIQNPIIEFDNATCEPSFDSHCFVPVDDSAIDIFRGLAEPTKVVVTA